MSEEWAENPEQKSAREKREAREIREGKRVWRFMRGDEKKKILQNSIRGSWAKSSFTFAFTVH